MKAKLLNGIHLGDRVAFEPANDRPVDGTLERVQHERGYFGGVSRVSLTVSSDNWRWTGTLDEDHEVKTMRDLPDVWDEYA